MILVTKDQECTGSAFAEGRGPFLAPMYWDDLDGVSIPVEYDREGYLANGSEGLLLIHHHNASGNRAQVVKITPGPVGTGGVPVPAEVE